MELTIELPETVAATIERVAKHQKTDTTTLARQAILERYDKNSTYNGVATLEDALAELDALPAPEQTLDWSKINTASCYEDVP